MWMNAPAVEGGWAEDGQLAGENTPSEEGHEVNGYSLHPFMHTGKITDRDSVSMFTFTPERSQLAPGSHTVRRTSTRMETGARASVSEPRRAKRGTPRLRRMSRWVWRRGTNDSQKMLGKITSLPSTRTLLGTRGLRLNIAQSITPVNLRLAMCAQQITEVYPQDTRSGARRAVRTRASWILDARTAAAGDWGPKTSQSLCYAFARITKM